MRAVCSGTDGIGCCGWSDMAKPPEITSPTPLSTLRLTHSPTVSGLKWDSRCLLCRSLLRLAVLAGSASLRADRILLQKRIVLERFSRTLRCPLPSGWFTDTRKPCSDPASYSCCIAQSHYAMQHRVIASMLSRWRRHEGTRPMAKQTFAAL